jgi:oligopeptide transport system ATP-binding protein
MAKEQEILLKGQGLVKEFKSGKQVVHAVSDVDIEIRRGETLSLVGESGCGKSTLGRLLLGLLPPTAGKIWFEGQELTAMDRKEFQKIRRDIQCIFQDPYSSLDPRLSVASSIAEPLVINKIGTKESRQKRVEELLKIVGIPVEYKNRFPHQFSGGQRQRIGIARALALNPKLIVCDEPISALDVSIQAQVLNLLMDLQQEMGLTYLFISHDLNVVRCISDRIYIMYLGSVCEYGEAEAIFEHPRHPYTHFLLSAVPVVDPDDRIENKDIIAGEIPSPMNPPSGCKFHTRCPYATDICKTETPAFQTEEGRCFACHHPL